MGAFCVNVHIRTDDQNALVRELQALPIGGCWVLPEKGKWATVCEERASSQDSEWICELSGRLSERLRTAAIAFLIHDSDIFCYWLFDRGELLDHFNSFPDYFEPVDDAERQQSRGRPEVLLRFCPPGRKEQEVESALREKSVFAEEQAAELARVLGIDSERVYLDFQYIGEDQTPEELGAVFVGDEPPAGEKPWGGRRFSIFQPDDEDTNEEV